MLLCLNNSNCADGGGRCISGVCVCTNYIIRHNSLTLPMIGAILRDLSSLRYFYIIIFSIIALIGLINNIFSFFTFIRDRIRFTICGIYLLLFSLCGIILMLLFLTNLIVAFHYEHYGVRLWACQGYPYVFQAMIYMELLLTTAIVVENILSRYFGLNRFRSRRCAILVFTIFFILVFPLNLDKIFTRHLVYTPSGRLYCTHRPQSSSFWYYINKSTFYCYIITPLIIHFISLIFILWKIKKQKQQWHLKIFLHQDILLPSFLILVCLFPYVLFRQLLDSCLMNNQLLIRLHIGLILLLLIPQIFTFIIYVLPNMYYIKEFQQTGFYYILCCGTKKGRELTDFENVSRLWHRRTSLETVMTISSLNDGFIDTELYNKIKLEI